MNYHDYLKLDVLLNAQTPRSFELNRPAHDEMLFITIHQSYEIWFKQVLFDLDSVIDIFNNPPVDETNMGTIVQRLQRMVMIIKDLTAQVDILETMTPLDFLDFRDLLYPASGFQSAQFRVLENKFGLRPTDRMTYNQQVYTTQLKQEQQQQVHAAEKAANLFQCVESWLERTPFLNLQFWNEYSETVRGMFKNEEEELRQNPFLSEEDKTKSLAQIGHAKSSFESILDEKKFNTDREQGHWRLSHKAVRAALLIQLYRDQPVFQLPFRLITAAQDLDLQLTQWRHRHALMVQRMLGKRVGTGGSSGADYLRATSERHRVFQDLFQLTTYFIPRSKLPALSDSTKKALGFYFSSQQDQPS